jgi:tetratricopeptide (TPR) repeat protein
MPNEKKPQVFLSYASENLDMVRKVYEGLVKRNLNVWFDKVNLKLGLPWKPQIEKAIANSRYFVICISEAAIRKLSTDKPGFQDNELHFAYNIASTHGPQDFGIIPVRLEDCGRGDFRLSGWQQLDLFENYEEGLDKLSVNMGGISLSDPTAKDERSEKDKLISSIYNKAFTEYNAGRFTQTIALLDSILVLSPDHAGFWCEKGIVLDDLGKPNEAIKAYDQAIKIKPDYAKAWYNKGVVLGRLDKDEEAIKAFDQAIKIKPDHAKAWYNKGVAFIKLGKPKEAIKAFDQAIKIKPDDAEAWYHKGFALRKLGRNKEAIDACNQALKITPNGFLALRLKGELKKKAHDQKRKSPGGKKK